MELEQGAPKNSRKSMGFTGVIHPKKGFHCFNWFSVAHLVGPKVHQKHNPHVELKERDLHMDHNNPLLVDQPFGDLLTEKYMVQTWGTLCPNNTKMTTANVLFISSLLPSEAHLLGPTCTSRFFAVKHQRSPDNASLVSQSLAIYV